MGTENQLLGELTIIIPKFLTHIARTNNKKALNKYWKINNQSIYNGAINTFSRAIVVENLHKYVMEHLPDTKITEFPITVSIVIRTVKNHGDIRMTKKGISWKKPDENYTPTWDEDNLTTIWTKVIRDAMTQKFMIPDDNVNFILGGYRGIEFVENIEQREIIIKIKKHETI